MDFGVVDPATTRELRRSVLRPDFGPDDALPGDELADAENAWHLRQMATDPQHRGRGVGAAVLAGAVDVVRERGAPLLWCHARQRAVPFYARHGFRVHGERFVEHGLPHRRMWRELSAAPTSSEQ